MRTRIIVLLSVAVLVIAGVFITVRTATAAPPPPSNPCGHSEWYVDSTLKVKIVKLVNCSKDRSWTWDILKTADQSALTLSPGQSFLVNYSVTANATPSATNFAVDGTIEVHNYNPEPVDGTPGIAVTINSVSDSLAGVTCELYGDQISFPYNLPANTTMVCKYNSETLSSAPNQNAATVSYDSVAPVTVVAPIDWSKAAVVTEKDKCANISDTYKGALGQVCATDAQKTFTFSYQRTIGPYATCGLYTVDNTASFVTNDTPLNGSSSWIVDVTVPCAGGCSLTPGYWKTHSSYGPAPYDDTWAQIGENTPFFSSGKSWYQVLWTAPRGNAYYILAHAYIAAKLNGLNGADTSAVAGALSWSESFFNTYTPSSSLSKSLRGLVLTFATQLDMYNNGYIGPGHCSE
jgi:hypothetical protein